MLRDLVGPVAWGSPTDLMSPEAYGTMTAVAMQVDGIMNSAAIPAKYPKCMPTCDPNQSPEAEGSNVYSGQNEASLWRTLRDHKRAMYSIKVSDVRCGFVVCVRVYVFVGEEVWGGGWGGGCCHPPATHTHTATSLDGAF